LFKLVSTFAWASILVFSAPTLHAGPSTTDADAALRKDLTAVIMLLGSPCGQVIGVERRAENDHLALCADGARYRVFVNAAGRVEAQRQ
jgi:hypothetical protein